MEHHPARFSNWFGLKKTPDKEVQYLPFRIQLVQTQEDLLKAVHVRYTAYARHLPEFAETLAVPEDADYEFDNLVLLATSKLDGSAIGSIRMQSNFYRALDLEASVELPTWLQHKRLVEVTRLAVTGKGAGRLVKMALIKACFDHCESTQMHYALVTGRTPIDRQYEQLLFSDVFDDKAPVPLRHVGNVPHRVMAFEIESGQARWEAAAHPMLEFFKKVRHPDIHIDPNKFGAAWTA